jgi:ABC-type phosphate/phosphonate transport system substrate-binding protein
MIALGLGDAGDQRAQARAGTTRIIRIGLIGSLFRDTPEPLVQVMARPFKSLLEAQTGTVSQIVAAGDANNLGQKLKDKQVQLGVFHGFEFAWARQNYPKLKPLIICVNRYPEQRALLMVHRDSKAASHADLAGKPLALPWMAREHCRLFLERRCVKTGTTPAKFFSRIITPGDPEEALDEVVDGKVGAAVIDATDLEAYKKAKPGRSRQLRTLLESDAFPTPVLAYHDGVLSADLVKRFRTGLINAKSTTRGKQLLEMIRITSFEAVPANYERSLTTIAKVYPPPAAK